MFLHLSIYPRKADEPYGPKAAAAIGWLALHLCLGAAQATHEGGKPVEAGDCG